MNYGEAAYGLRQILLTDTAGANPVYMSAGILLHFTEEIMTEEFRAEGIRVASRSFTTGIDWELEAGGISLAAYAKLTGRTAPEVGSVPNRSITVDVNQTTNFPYIRIYGRSVDDYRGDFYCRIHRAKLTSIEGTLREGQFIVTSCAGVGVSDPAFGFYQFVQRETAAAI